MHKELELWQFISSRLENAESVMLLVVAESSGSSPGRQGYKMAVAEDGELIGSIGGGVMEVNLVNEARKLLRHPETRGLGDSGMSMLREQVHRNNDEHASGMICSGKQTVILILLTPEALHTVGDILNAVRNKTGDVLTVTSQTFSIGPAEVSSAKTADGRSVDFESSNNPKSKIQNPKFKYTEHLGFQDDLYIIGGGHCALALSELMSRMDFRITLFDDRPDLNTIAKNKFAHDIRIIESYEKIGEHVPSGDNVYVVVMTLGYKTDDIVIRSLFDREFKYFGVLGSNAKMSLMLKSLVKEGFPAEKLDAIRTPVGIQINSRTPEEIAVSIAAEIIAVKNSG